MIVYEIIGPRSGPPPRSRRLLRSFASSVPIFMRTAGPDQAEAEGKLPCVH
jgi:hypothetical protein